LRDLTVIPGAAPNLYNGPDIYNPALEAPESAVNYLAIVENDAKRSQLRRHLVTEWTLCNSDSAPVDTSDAGPKYHVGRRLLGNGGISFKAGAGHCTPKPVISIAMVHGIQNAAAVQANRVCCRGIMMLEVVCCSIPVAAGCYYARKVLKRV